MISTQLSVNRQSPLILVGHSDIETNSVHLYVFPFFPRSKESLPAPPKNINFTLHFYNYHPPTLHCALIPPPLTASKKSPAKLQSLPHLIRPVESSTSSDAGKAAVAVSS